MTIHRISAALFIASALLAQSSDPPDWQKIAGGKMAFDAASVKPVSMSTSFPRPTSMPVVGNAKPPGGHLYLALPMFSIVGFAWKLSAAETRTLLAQLPQWTRNEMYEIDARAEGNPTKDQMRLMVQSLLADRLKLAVHFETREAPVFALTPVKPGRLGPNLRPHSAGPPCPASYTEPVFSPPPPRPADAFPANCGTIELKDHGAILLIGGRNVTVSDIADVIYTEASRGGEVDWPIVDRTGLTGAFDFTFDTTPFSAAPNAQPDQPPPSILDTIRRQLGLKLERSTGPVRTLIIDHIEKPTPN